MKPDIYIGLKTTIKEKLDFSKCKTDIQKCDYLQEYLINNYYFYPDFIKKKTRERDYILQRFIYFYILYENGITYRKIGLYCLKTHADIMHGVKKIKDLLSIKDKELNKYLQILK